jgi:hypothetical protein
LKDLAFQILLTEINLPLINFRDIFSVTGVAQATFCIQSLTYSYKLDWMRRFLVRIKIYFEANGNEEMLQIYIATTLVAKFPPGCSVISYV